MCVLPDECVPRKLRREITAESIKTVQEMGWAGIKNGELLRRAVTHFDVLLTTDQNIEYQQNMKPLDIAVVVDEEGEDYLYPSDCFSPVYLEESVAKSYIMQNSTGSNTA